MKEEKIFQLKITLEGIEPDIWRRILVKESIDFHALHNVIQDVMGWENCHMFEFEFDDAVVEADKQGGIDSMFMGFRPKNKRILKASKTKLEEMIREEKQEFSYVYDLGDYWQHCIIAEKILENDASQEFPICIGGARACPPEDCGSVPGYEELMEIRKDKKHPEYEERIVEWLGEDFDPEYFNLREANRELGVNKINKKYLETSEKELLEKIVDLEEKKEYEQALKYAEKILKQNPSSYHALFLKYRINKKLGKTCITDLKLAYEEAKKQGASEEVSELMEDELDDFDDGIDMNNLNNYQKETHMINMSIKEYGMPSLTNNFFETNKIEMFSAASIGYNLLLNPEIESKTIKKINKNLPKPRKDLVDKEREEILSTKSPDKLLQIMMKGIDVLNENVMMGKMLEFEEWTIPKLIDILKTNTNDFLVESSIKFIYNGKSDNTKLILHALPSIKVAHNLSMACMLLGLIGNKDAIKPVWDCYHFLKEEYPLKSYNQGPLLALFKFKEKWQL